LALVETTQVQRDQALKDLEKATDEQEALNNRITALEKELRESVAHAETILAEKDQIEKQLAEFQEHWEKFRKT